MGIQYRPAIDGLRAIAVSSVVLFHAGIGKAGFVGVDIFFVISGYLITALLLAERRDTGRIDLLAFYARRVRRIFPAAALVVVCVLIASPMVFAFEEQAETARSAGAALVFAANVFFEYNTGGYWDWAAEEMPLLHLWSLSVEEQFYLLWPALLLFARSRIAFATIALVSLGLAEYWIATNPEAAFYRMPARAWELAAGGLIATLPTWRLPRFVGIAGVALVLVACVVRFDHFPGIGALPAVAGACLVIAAAHGGAHDRLLASKPMVALGLVSYSLYLWHWPLLAFYRASGGTSLVVKLALCVLALVLAVLTYRFVEQRFRKMRFPARRTVVFGAALSGMFALTACAIAYRPAPSGAEDAFPLATQAEHGLPPYACTYWHQDTAFPKCPITARNAVWGDSLAYAWRPWAEQIGPIADFSRQGCGPFIGWMPPEKHWWDGRCRDFNANVAKALRGMETVIIVARWNAERMPAFRQSLAAVAPHVGQVVVIGPTPQLREFVPTCIRKSLDCTLPRAEFEARARPLRAALRDAAKPYPNVRVVDYTDYFCTQTACPAVLRGVPLYRDQYHVTIAATMRVPFDLHKEKGPASLQALFR